VSACKNKTLTALIFWTFELVLNDRFVSECRQNFLDAPDCDSNPEVLQAFVVGPSAEIQFFFEKSHIVPFFTSDNRPHPGVFPPAAATRATPGYTTGRCSVIARVTDVTQMTVILVLTTASIQTSAVNFLIEFGRAQPHPPIHCPGNVDDSSFPRSCAIPVHFCVPCNLAHDHFEPSKL